MASFIDLLRTSTTDKVAEFLKSSEQMNVSGKREMGKALVLRVATLAGLAHKSLSLPNNTTFNIPNAVAIAQHTYTRLFTDVMGNITLTETATDTLLSDVVKYLHPFVYNGVPADADPVKLLAVTRKKAITAFSIKTGSEQKRKERTERVTKEMDAIIAARVNTTSALKLACLVVFHDQTGEHLSKFDPEKINGIWLPRHCFEYYQSEDDKLIFWDAKDKSDPILIQPVPNSNSNMEFTCKTKTAAGGDRKPVHKMASFPLLVTAATKPKDNSTAANPFQAACKTVREAVKASLQPDHELSADDMLELRELANAILAREKALQAAQDIADSNKASATILPATPVQKAAKEAAKGKRDADGAAVGDAALKLSA